MSYNKYFSFVAVLSVCFLVSTNSHIINAQKSEVGIFEPVEGLKTVYVYENSDMSAIFGSQNTRFVISKDINLLGKTVNIGAFSVLDFQGGSISNGTIVLSESNEIVGIPRLYTSFAGTYTRTVDISWFITEQERLTDASKKMTDICSFFKHIKSDGRTYYLSHQVNMDSMEDINLNSEFRYNGKDKNISVFYISSSQRANFYIKKVIHNSGPGGSNSKNLINDTDNIIGVNIVNADDCYIKTDFIYCFNEGLRLSAINHQPFSYNKIYPGEIVDCNRGIRVFQDTGGWANENYFYGGRLFIDTPAKRMGMKKVVAIHIEGAGKSDTYNRVDALSFTDFCVEGYKSCLGYTIYVKNAAFCSFNRFRNEGGDYLIKFVGRCFNNSYSLSYFEDEAREDTRKSLLVDISECTSGVLTPESFTRRLDKPTDSLFLFKMNNNGYTLLSKMGTYNDVPMSEVVGYVVNVTTLRERLIGIECNKPTILKVQYISDSKGNKISNKTVVSNFRAPNHLFSIDKNRFGYTCDANGIYRTVLNIPENIGEIFVGYIKEIEQETVINFYSRF